MKVLLAGDKYCTAAVGGVAEQETEVWDGNYSIIHTNLIW